MWVRGSEKQLLACSICCAVKAVVELSCGKRESDYLANVVVVFRNGTENVWFPLTSELPAYCSAFPTVTFFVAVVELVHADKCLRRASHLRFFYSSRYLSASTQAVCVVADI